MSTKMIVLKSSDNVEFQIEEDVARQCLTIAHWIDDENTNNGVPLTNVKGKILALVTEYCIKHHVDREKPEDLKTWDDKWFMNLQTDPSTLLALILAANYLDNKTLLDRACQAMADMITEKTVEQIFTDFNIEKGYTDEEEREVLEKINGLLIEKRIIKKKL
ncbi:hypothetical protein CARUB_v10015131mg [Capsella rubella]|uniref:SKP1-like protein n=1 Tax=Capsella rubella TaxID=81985 RepID=R0I667_9BRAS|nr:SKP1-like protein 11 [Capsella rubella]EOA31903.1 hypothetical protein CARUB_v10015131mg [Capsella rubella]